MATSHPSSAPVVLRARPLTRREAARLEGRGTLVGQGAVLWHPTINPLALLIVLLSIGGAS